MGQTYPQSSPAATATRAAEELSRHLRLYSSYEGESPAIVQKYDQVYTPPLLPAATGCPPVREAAQLKTSFCNLKCLPLEFWTHLKYLFLVLYTGFNTCDELLGVSVIPSKFFFHFWMPYPWLLCLHPMASTSDSLQKTGI